MNIGIIIIFALITQLVIPLLAGILFIPLFTELKEKNKEFFLSKFGDISLKNLFFVRDPVRNFKFSKFIFSKESILMLPESKNMIYFQRISILMQIIGLILVISLAYIFFK